MKNLLALIALSLFLTSTRQASAQTIHDVLPPEDQGVVRSEKHFAVGLPVSDPYNMPGQYQVRPSAALTLGISFVGAVDAGHYTMSSDETLKARASSAALYVEYYPIPHSGFHLGAGAEDRWGSYRVLKAKPGLGDVAVAEGRYRALYGGPSFGWTWLWNNGVTFGFDLTKRKRFKTDFTDNGAAQDARVDRDSEVVHQLVPETVGGMLFLGYSF